jgi:hypothetical protein
MMLGDVTVVGLDTSTTVLYDIGMDVPHRSVVTIQADKATLSKDLWRAISQRRLFQLHSGSITQGSVRPVVPPSLSIEAWQERCKHLEVENQALKDAVRSLQRELAAKSDAPITVAPTPVDPRLDEILQLLRSGQTMGGASAPARSAPAVKGVVEVDVPTFIPNEIKPKSVEGRIAEVQAETSEKSNLGSAADALRKMRQGRQ